MLDSTSRLHAAIAAVCPIEGISIGTSGQASSVTIHYASSAAADQEAAAQAALARFDWSDAAQTAWQLAQNQAPAAVQVGAGHPGTIGIRALGLQCLAAINAAAAAINTIAVNQAAIAAKAGVTITTVAALPQITEDQAKAAIGGQLNEPQMEHG